MTVSVMHDNVYGADKDEHLAPNHDIHDKGVGKFERSILVIIYRILFDN